MEGLGHLAKKCISSFAEEKHFGKPDDILEGLADVHDEIPDKDNSSSYSSINVPEPETANGWRNTTTLKFLPEEKSIEPLISKLTSNPEEHVPVYVCDLKGLESIIQQTGEGGSVVK